MTGSNSLARLKKLFILDMSNESMAASQMAYFRSVRMTDDMEL